MDTLAYTKAYSVYEDTQGIEYEPLDLNLDINIIHWLKISNSAWLSLLALGIIAATLNAAPAMAQVKVNTPKDGCLNARLGPGTNYGVYTCVSDGAVLKPIVGTQGQWLKLSSGRWVYSPYTTYNQAGVGGQTRKVNTPDKGCLNARLGPGTSYGVYTCVPNGTALKPVAGSQGDWLKLSSGRWVYGPYTTVAQGGNSSPGTGGTVILSSGATGQAVRDVQLRLQTLKYYTGEIDGIYGPKTLDAVKRFQTAEKLELDGIVGPKTRQALF